MKTLLFIALNLCVYLAAQAQCRVKSETKEDGLYVQAAKERIYRNDDLEEGLQSAYAAILVKKVKQGTMPVNRYFLIIYTAASGAKQLVTPRVVSVAFNRGATIRLNADNFMTLDRITGIRQEACTFELSYEQFEVVKSSAITSIQISDNRTGDAITAKPYNAMLQEQIACIQKQLP